MQALQCLNRKNSLASIKRNPIRILAKLRSKSDPVAVSEFPVSNLLLGLLLSIVIVIVYCLLFVIVIVIVWSQRWRSALYVFFITRARH